MDNDLRERMAERIWRNWPGVKDNDMLIAEPELVQARVYEMTDVGLAVFREWLESEAQVEPVARALGTLAGAKFDVFSELTGLPYDDWLAWSSEARAALKALLEGTVENEK